MVSHPPRQSPRGLSGGLAPGGPFFGGLPTNDVATIYIYICISMNIYLYIYEYAIHNKLLTLNSYHE